ncbi:hypothetical protein IAI10_20290 [Clostridium sp. 19966]|uniref:hypothetical protein n=1 Tax=Clostridium sp. 19966 TaxID=2768166 RepID=UPI0028DF78EB|nr:hypothetical protein [Clostridium sp. 19966]MDT8718997.1 hypothetical protein [Clostridium sp. 19966]
MYKKYMARLKKYDNNEFVGNINDSIKNIKKTIVKQEINFVYRDIRDLKWELQNKENFTEKEWNEMLEKLDTLMEDVLIIKNSVENI